VDVAVEVYLEGADALVRELVVEGGVGVVEGLRVGNVVGEGGAFGRGDLAVVGVVRADYLDLVQAERGVAVGVLWKVFLWEAEGRIPELAG